MPLGAVPGWSDWLLEFNFCNQRILLDSVIISDAQEIIILRASPYFLRATGTSPS